MTYSITVSSKNQITIPSEIARELQIGPGDKLVVTFSGSSIHLQKAKDTLDALEGSVTLPEKYANKDIGFIIRDAKSEFFKHRK